MAAGCMLPVMGDSQEPVLLRMIAWYKECAAVGGLHETAMTLHDTAIDVCFKSQAGILYARVLSQLQ
jgi:hypothetical protein